MSLLNPTIAIEIRCPANGCLLHPDGAPDSFAVEAAEDGFEAETGERVVQFRCLTCSEVSALRDVEVRRVQVGATQ